VSYNCGRRLPLVIGITGGLGTGKSTVAGILKDMTAPVIDADAVTHQLLQPGTCVYDRVVSRFSPDIVDEEGLIDRKKLANIVFSHEEARRDLERIVHPAVIEQMEQEIQMFACRGQDLAVLDVPLLLEVGLDELCDEVWVVWCTPQQQLARVMRRDDLDCQKIKRRMTAQMPMQEKVKLADRVVDNSGSLCELRDEVFCLWRRLQNRVGDASDGG